MPVEAIFSEVLLSEVQEFISVLYGALLRFYMPVVDFEELEELTEDLVELVTSLTINKTLSPWLLKLCRLSAREDEAMLGKMMKQFGDLLPEQVGVSEYFTLNSSSMLVRILKEVTKQARAQLEEPSVIEAGVTRASLSIPQADSFLDADQVDSSPRLSLEFD